MESLVSIINEINNRLRTEEIRVEDVSTRIKLLQPLEYLVLSSTSQPEALGGPGGAIATSLWYKNYPDQANLDQLFVYLEYQPAIVRLCAADAILATLKSGHPKWSDPQFAYSARTSVTFRRELEPSPIIAHLLDQILAEMGTSRPRKRKRTKVTVNPYIAGMPVQGRDKFFGREDILAEIKECLLKSESYKSIVLYGARRTGKTSVLLQIKAGALGSNFLPVYIDMQALAGIEMQVFLRALLLNTLDAVRERREINTGRLPPIRDQEVNFAVMKTFFERVLQDLDDTSLVLMLDEYEVLGSYLSTSNLARQIQSLLETEPRLFVIFAGSQKLEALRERQKRFLFLLDNAKYFKISFLKRDEALELIKAPAKGKLDYAPGAPERILEYTAGHPFYVQLLCQTIFNNARDNHTVTVDNVDEAVREFLLDPAPHLILTWNAIKLEHKVVGSSLAESQLNKDDYVRPTDILRKLRDDEYPLKLNLGEVEQGLNALRDIDWVERKEGGGRLFRFSMEIVRRWIHENKSIWELAQQQRDEVFSKVANFWPQRFAWLIDFLALPCALVFGLYILLFSDLSAGLLILVACLVPVTYFVGSIMARHSTLGMLLFHLRVVSARALPLTRKQSVLYGLTLMGRFFLMVCVVGVFGKFFLGLLESPIVFLLAIVGIAVEVLDLISILYGRKRQGIYDKLMGTLIVPITAIKE